MKKSHLLLSILAVLTLILHPQSAEAKKPKATPVPEFHTVIQSVSDDSITVKEPNETKTYKIDKFTEIRFNDQLAKVSDLKSGMRVEVTPGVDSTVAGRISATGAPKK